MVMHAQDSTNIKIRLRHLSDQVPRLRPVWMLGLLSIAFTCIAVAQPSQIQRLISAGNLDGMRWPNFRDYQSWLQRFYEPTGYAPAWTQANTPSPQSLSMIEVLRNAWQKGLEPEDYDGSRWDSRLHRLQGSGYDQAVFDVALTVCAM